MKKFRILLFIAIFNALIFAHQFSGLDYIIDSAISNHIFPGATIIIGTDSIVLYNHGYGRFTYSNSSSVVNTNHMFDQASCTKVFATTSCIMKLVDSGLVDIEEKVAYYIPDFAQNGKENVKIKHLLLHTSGMPAYYTPSAGQTPQQIINAIFALLLQNTAGSTYVYSCLNFVTLMKVVKAVTGKAMWEFYRNTFTEPLGMHRTMFCPPDSLKDQCLPTSSVAGYQGIVHDPLARGLDGLSGNAGLFSTTGDLAKICQLLLNGGVYNGIRYISNATVTLFTTQYSSGSSRALGWGTNANSSSSAGSLLSPESFGHTGYTGTSVWCDPVRKLFIAFLTNRVYPNDQASVTSTRALVADAAVRAIEGIPPQPIMYSIQRDANENIVFLWNPNSVMGAIDKTEIWIDFGDGFQLYNEVGVDTSEIVIHSGQYPADSMIVIKLLNRFEDNSSAFSDQYAIRGWKKDLLIVDGYDRIGSWGQASHHFVVIHAKALPDTIHFESCDNDQIIAGNVNLLDYKYVLWILADESTSDETFSSEEQTLVKDYFKQGSCLFVSGSEIGWDLDYKGSASDRNFYNGFLRADFAGDDAGSLSASGVSGTIFEGLSFSYGTSSALYYEDYPDYIYARNGGKICLKYGNNRNAGVYYEGTYNGSTEIGKLVYLGFPFETIVVEQNRKELMHRVIEFFQQPTTEISQQDIKPVLESFVLYPNYPNPFNMETTIRYQIPCKSHINLSIYDINGNLIKTLRNDCCEPGLYREVWNGLDNYHRTAPSGIYFSRLSASGNVKKTNKLTLVK
ncbi:MAG: serine hydrolase [Candidatus Marinimicrobia bacterium]|nr:serine hydrolase [Candidatus Neomarinimicrobiota bacterium]